MPLPSPAGAVCVALDVCVVVWPVSGAAVSSCIVSVPIGYWSCRVLSGCATARCQMPPRELQCSRCMPCRTRYEQCGRLVVHRKLRGLCFSYDISPPRPPLYRNPTLSPFHFDPDCSLKMSKPLADCSLSDFALEITLATRTAVSAQMDYGKHTIAQLKDLCAQRGLVCPERAKKAVYIEILKNSPAVDAVSSSSENEGISDGSDDSVGSFVDSKYSSVDGSFVDSKYSSVEEIHKMCRWNTTRSRNQLRLLMLREGAKPGDIIELLPPVASRKRGERWFMAVVDGTVIDKTTDEPRISACRWWMNWSPGQFTGPDKTMEQHQTQEVRCIIDWGCAKDMMKKERQGFVPKRGVDVAIDGGEVSSQKMHAQTDYEKHTIAQLKDLCAQRGLFRPERATKAVYIEILKNSPAVDAAALQDDDSSAVDNWRIGSSIDIEEMLNAGHLPQYIDLSKPLEDDNCVRPIQKVQLAALGSRLQYNTSILHFNIFGNDIGPDGMRELLHPIGTLTGLQQLDLGGVCVCMYDCFSFCIL
jgi:hypothetical protein